MAVATDTRAVGEAAALAIGGTVALDALFGGPITGASMNPARSAGPAIAAGELSDLWIYIAAPLVGASLARARLPARCAANRLGPASSQPIPRSRPLVRRRRDECAGRDRHRHPRQPARSRGGAHADRGARNRADLLRWRSRRLRTAPERGVRAPQPSGRSRRSTATTTTRSGATSRTAAAPIATPREREIGELSIAWTLANTDARLEGVHARAPLRPPLRARREARPPRPRLAAEGERVPASRTSRRARSSGSPRSPTATSSSSAIRTSPGCASTAACSSSTAARSASRRTATRAAASPSSRTARASVRVSIERVEYDAEAVASEMRRVGLPAGLAEQLPLAA